MKKTLSRTFLAILLLVAFTYGVSTTAFAVEVADNISLQSSQTSNAGEIVEEERNEARATRSSKSIYSDIETLIYTGRDVDRWLHITPWTTPNRFTIRMVDYQGNTVWEETFKTSETTHWFVGSNVRYVYLKGIPGGVVDVSDTEH